MVHALFKYDTAARAFRELGRSGTLSPACDALAVDAAHFSVTLKGNGVAIRGAH